MVLKVNFSPSFTIVRQYRYRQTLGNTNATIRYQKCSTTNNNLVKHNLNIRNKYVAVLNLEDRLKFTSSWCTCPYTSHCGSQRDAVLPAQLYL